ncbi:Fanconi anemia group M protein isoform X5 [Alosa sapidissima]|uniref:Fanconi anemia group M protein isoform X5 n=1 Tax=Alosa sapidissima TaxID=34773 RepID=UPI001C09DA8B|nr:Fanconi anemia group M protein isoform X5 [Alosa sapidissima]
MSGANQKTLFQTWGASVPHKVAPNEVGKKNPGRRKVNQNQNSQKVTKQEGDNSLPLRKSLWGGIGQGSTASCTSNVAEAEDDDELMLVAVYEAEKSLESIDGQYDIQTSDTAVVPSALSSDLPGFDISSGKVWIYPTNYPIRDYQLKISEASLFQNTLVCLPTGLGKTFIASVVMYNFYRWYPYGKIVFMAPTKPLVAQQIEACYKVMGIPQEHMAELTGSTPAQQRRELWRLKRVFFLTPQVMVNDLSRNTCPATQVKCVVIDEAHKASGNHAYCQVVRELGNQTRHFRVLALSATPGGDMKAVQQVISNLLISHIELRSEESPDIQAHSHQRSLDKVVVPLGESLKAYQTRYLLVLERFTARLTQLRLLSNRDLCSLTKYQLILARQQFRSNPPTHVQGAQHGAIEGDFALSISLYHGYELLMQMGLRSLFLFIQGIMGGAKETSRARNELQRNIDFMDLYKEMEAMFQKPTAGPEEPFFYTHPKLQKLDEVVQQHFQSWSQNSAGPKGADQEESTRVMIFSSFRESVQEIANILSRHQPLIKVMTFMGQASAGKGVRGFTQKEQLAVVRQFKEGGFNTLVSTCVGEEGLDIGEVDLIVCFDAQKSPIRLVQRMGRTGRRRQGRIVVILAEGREERTYNQSQSNRRSVNRSILENNRSFHMFPNSPRMLPDGLTPTLHKMHITCGQFEARDTSQRASKGRKSVAGGRESLVHPSTVVRGPEESQRRDGFLTPAEFSLWASTMRLSDDEPQPMLPQTHFLSLSTDAPPQEEAAAGPKRELSLWEWRHWQNRPQHTHRLGHSDRCLHFTALMDLIDNLKQEEGQCSYEAELMPYLHKEDVVGFQEDDRWGKLSKRQKETKLFPTKLSKNTRFSHTSTCSAGLDEDIFKEKKPKVALESPWTIVKDKVPPEIVPDSRHDNRDLVTQSQCSTISAQPLMDMDFDCVLHSDEDSSPTKKPLGEEFKVSIGVTDGIAVKQPRTQSTSVPHCEEQSEEQNSEFEELFYLPKLCKNSTLKPFRESSASLTTILENVKQLLSISPPHITVDVEFSLTDASPNHEITRDSKVQPNLLHEDEPFQINFCLEENYDDADADDNDDGTELMEVDSVEHEVKEMSAGSPDLNESTCLPKLQKEPTESLREMTSPTWDEVFEDENKESEVEDDIKLVQPLEHAGSKDPLQHSIMDESVDLFGDDEVFLQVSLPDIPTPDKNFSNHTASELLRVRKGPEESPAETVFKASADSTRISNTMSPSDVHQQPVQNSEHFDLSQDFFSVNFDLGYCLEDEDEDEEEDEVEVREHLQCTPPLLAKSEHENTQKTLHKPSHAITTPMHLCPVSVTTPGSCLKQTGEASALSVKDYSFLSPSLTLKQRLAIRSKTSTPSHATLTSHERRPETTAAHQCLTSAQREAQWSTSRKSLLPKVTLPADQSVHFPQTEHAASDSEDDIIIRKRSRQGQLNPLSSPEQSKILSDVDSPVQVIRKHVLAPRNIMVRMSEESDVEALSDDDFQHTSLRQPRAQPAPKHSNPGQTSKGTVRRRARQFLDDEAELSEEDGSVSSDEEDDEEQNRMLEGFVVDNSHLSQGLDDSEMQGIYLKSVRSPAVPGKFKMVYKPTNNMDVFSQVPEQDESYAEDSFVVHGSDVEMIGSSEGEEDEVKLAELIGEDSYVDGRRNYATRRKAQFREARGREAIPEPARKTKRSRIIRMEDSSDEEQGEGGLPMKQAAPASPEAAKEKQQLSVFKTPLLPPQPSAVVGKSSSHGPKPQLNPLEERNRQRLQNQARLSEELDFDVMPSTLRDKLQAGNSLLSVGHSLGPSPSPSPSAIGPVCVLVDSRCISSGPEVVSALRLRHGVTAQVCSLDGCDFVVSNRMAVERQTQGEVAVAQNRKRLLERMHSLQGLFERVCLILEADRTRPGEASRPFQRTRYYDSTLGGLVQAGIRLLSSTGAEDTAGLLAELARVEQRKGQAISVPLEVKGHQQQQALQFYLTLPCVSYINALNMCHNFPSVAQLVDSSLEALQKGACVSRSRAEEIYRCLRYSSDVSLMATR